MVDPSKQILVVFACPDMSDQEEEKPAEEIDSKDDETSSEQDETDSEYDDPSDYEDDITDEGTVQSWVYN